LASVEQDRRTGASHRLALEAVMVGIGRSYCGAQEAFPSRKVARAPGPLESISESVDEGGAPREFFSKPFEFLSLGLLAYVGAPPHRGRALNVCTEVVCSRCDFIHCWCAKYRDNADPCEVS